MDLKPPRKDAPRRCPTETHSSDGIQLPIEWDRTSLPVVSPIAGTVAVLSFNRFPPDQC